MKKVVAFLSLSLLLLCGCDGENRFPELKSGSRVDLDNSNVRTYLIVNLKHTEKKDKQDSIVKISYTFKSQGYSELSYFISVLTCEISYQYLGDDGEYADKTDTVSINPDKVGNGSGSSSIECNYRSIKDMAISNFVVEGYIVKK